MVLITAGRGFASGSTPYPPYHDCGLCLVSIRSATFIPLARSSSWMDRAISLTALRRIPMRKLRLDLDALVVDSFDSSPGRRDGRGTVRGHATEAGGNTCDYCVVNATHEFVSCYASDCGCPVWTQQGCYSAGCSVTCRWADTCGDGCPVDPT